jgi:hypothetical protein
MQFSNIKEKLLNKRLKGYLEEWINMNRSA